MATALGILGGVSVAAGQIAPTWVDFDTMPGVNGFDEIADIVYSGVGPDRYVYVTGYQTTLSGATVIATAQFKADFDPAGQHQKTVYFPSDPATAIGTNKASSMTIDPITGDIFVAGEMHADNGQDYVVIKYDKDLNVHQSWLPNLNDPVIGVRTYDGTASGDDRIVDIEFARFSQLEAPLIVVTGESQGQRPPLPSVGVSTGFDVVTIGYNATTGERNGGSFSGLDSVHIYDANYGDDRPAELRIGLGLFVFDPQRQPVEEYRAIVYIAATQWTDSVNRNDIVLLNYGVQDGNALWVMTVYNGRTSGEDIATGIDAFTTFELGDPVTMVTAIGITPHFEQLTNGPSGGPGAPLTVANNDYVALNFDAVLLDDPFTTALPRWSTTGYGKGIRVWNSSGTPLNSDDFAADIELVPGQFATSIAWITGRAGDPAGIVYGAGTIRYDTSTVNIPAPPDLVSFISGSQSVDEGVALASGSMIGFMVTGSTANPLPRDFLTFKIDDSMPNTPIWLATQDASGSVDRAVAMVAPFGTSGPVFVAGSGVRAGTGVDFMVIRYDSP